VSSLASFRQLYISKQPERSSLQPSGYSNGTLPSFVKKPVVEERSNSTEDSERSFNDEESLKSADHRPDV
jgi:hypothetical protein